MSELVAFARRWRWALAASVIFQIGFGFYYDYSEHLRWGFLNPFVSSQEYLDKSIVRPFHEGTPSGDNEAYNRAAYSILEFGRYQQATGTPSAWAPPGYPTFLALIYGLFGYRFQIVLIVQGLFIALSQLILAALAQKLWNERIALMTWGLLVINIRPSMFVGYVYSEALFFLIMSSALYLGVRQIQKRDKFERADALLAMILAYGMLVRPVLLAGVLAILASFALQKQFKRAVTIGLIAALGPGLWMARNRVLLGEWALTTSGPITSAEGNNDTYLSQSLLEPYRNSPNKAPFPALAPSILAQIDRTYAQDPGRDPERWLAAIRSAQLAEWRAHTPPVARLWMILHRAKALLSPYTYDMSLRQKLICTVLWLAIFPAALYGVWLGRKSWPLRLLMLFSFALLAMPALVVIGNSLRYQIPSQMVLTLFAAHGYQTLFNRRRQSL